MQAVQIPVSVAAAVFLGLAALGWRRVPVCARVFLGAGTTFLIAAIGQPGTSIDEILAARASGMAYLVAVARMAAAAAFLISVVTVLRDALAR